MLLRIRDDAAAAVSDWVFLLAGVVVIMLVALLVVMLWH